MTNMDRFTKPGSKIQYIGDGDGLIKYAIYTVKYIILGGLSTKVILEEHPKSSFDSRGFINYCGGHKLQLLYDSEINFKIETFWDGGFIVMLGDNLNGFKDMATLSTFHDAVDMLWEMAKKYYPNKECFKK